VYTYTPPDCNMALGSTHPPKKNEYQEYLLGGKGGRCVGLTTLPPSCADCLEIWEPQRLGTLRACPGLYRDCITFTFTSLSILSQVYVSVFHLIVI
jgi:hypothetical protein